MKPAHAALRSNDPQRSPSASPTNAAVWGRSVSGDAVASTSRSMSTGDSPARLIASAAAAVPSVDDVGDLVRPEDADNGGDDHALRDGERLAREGRPATGGWIDGR